MKQIFLIILFLAFSFVIVFASCNKDNGIGDNSNIENNENTDSNNETMGSKIRIKIGPSTFSATLLNNATATSFKAMLPMTINMSDLNSNEKFYDFPTNLSVNASNPSTIQTGDLMMYGSNTFVLFYKTFSTSYSYTKLGRIDDTTKLPAALGNGNVSVIFELE